MSGGFFRGTSADQDTRFSNKQAKLLKSQKFPPELEHLVDMTKVKMDVIRPWIATRATELLGFEDEVLINFIYGLLDVKLVDGKKIQIQLTGFMEKNTGKFMKELWGLLLSAQNNVSGVPQQFLDAKEEETRKKKAETDKIASEVQKRRERDGREPERERERERKSRFEDEADVLRSVNAAPESVPRHSRGRSSSIPQEEVREANGRQGSRAINGRSRSPQPNDRSPSPYRSTTSPTRLTKKTITRSRSHSGEEPKSRSVSVSSQSQGRSVSPERQYESPMRRSRSPERRYRSPRRSSSPRRRRAPLNTESPLRRRSPHLRRRSTSRSRHRSPSPYRRRSPRARQRSPLSPRRRSPFLSRRRIPSPPRRESLSPLRRRSPLPLRRRSPSPLRRRSPILVHNRSRTPVRRRSPSPLRRRSPVKARRRSPSPLRRRSPIRRRSPSPWRRSPLRRSPNQRRRSPVRSPINHPVDSHSSPRQRKRSRSPYRSRSPLYRTRRSLSKERDGRHRDEHDSQRTREKNSPVNHDLDRELAERAGSGQKASENVSRKVPISLRSPQRDVGNQSDRHDKVAATITEDSPSRSDSPANTRKLNSRITRRFRSLSKSPGRQTRAKMPRRDSPGTSREEEETSRAREVLRHKIDSSGKRSDNSRRDAGLKRSYIDDHGPESNSPDRVAPTQSPAARGRPMHSKKSSGHRSDVDLPERHSQQVSYSSDDNGYGPKSVRQERGSLGDVHDRQRSKHHPKDAPVLEEKAHNEKTDGYGLNDGKRSRSKDHREPHQEVESIEQKVDKSIRRDSKDSDSEKTGSDKHHIMGKRRHRGSDKRKRDSDESSESDSQIDDRKEAKRRRKDEKRLRKEEKRRRREEKHRKRLERRAKQNVKSVDTVTPPSDFEGNDHDSDNSDVDANMRKKFHPSDADEMESEQKKLEIELRKKALESLRAKKAISH